MYYLLFEKVLQELYYIDLIKLNVNIYYYILTSFMAHITQIEVLDEEIHRKSLLKGKWEKKLSSIISWFQDKTHRLLIKRGQKRGLPFYDFENLSRIWKIEVIYRGEKMKLNEKIKENIWVFLKYTYETHRIIWNNKEFNCVNFAHFLHDIPFKENTFEVSEWVFYTQKEKVKVWDTMLMLKKKPKIIDENDNIVNNGSFKKPAHLAVYIWEWFYISKIWTHDKLSITTLKNLKEIYEMDNYMLLRKKSFTIWR